MKRISICAYTLAFAASTFIVGCASTSTSAKKGEDSIAKFQATRTSTAPVESSLTNICPSVAASFNAAAISSAVLYKSIADKVDKEAAINRGRRTYLGFQNDVKALKTSGKSAEVARTEVLAKLTAEQKTLLSAYEQSIAKSDMDKIIAETTGELAKVGDAVVQLTGFSEVARKDSAFIALSGLQMLKANKALVTDMGKVKNQMGDASTAGKYLLQLYSEDREAQKFMKDYPVL